jgi:PncC family amidohydrolase
MPILKKRMYALIKKEKTLSMAESCTGGALAARLTRLPGCSRYFLGSIVAYSNEWKVQVLGVQKTVIQQFGAVSEQAVRQMAEGVLRLAKSDYSLAVSGIAGPTGESPGKPIGTIWAAIAQKEGETKAWTFQLQGSRLEIIEQTVVHLLQHLRDLIQ